MASNDYKTDRDALYDMAIDVTAVFGTSMMPISEVLELRHDADVEDTLANLVAYIIKSNID